MLLGAGRRQGVAPLSPVIAPSGLVGMVVAVDPHTSVVMAWTHPDFRVSAMVEGGKIFGVVAARRGETAGEVMELRGVPYRDSLPAGTPVVTSGLGGVFPRGIPVGTVLGMLSESAGWERTYLLRPAAHPAQVTHVLVLSARLAARLAGAGVRHAPRARPTRAAGRTRADREGPRAAPAARGRPGGAPGRALLAAARRAAAPLRARLRARGAAVLRHPLAPRRRRRGGVPGGPADRRRGARPRSAPPPSRSPSSATPPAGSRRSSSPTTSW